ncbi:GNAT family N-acetyltransferase [Companilactobacillus nuruki]|uniref:GNAT family N-acetyltransferase n=1 Tax=Companilactobacillus nuruki TaxID=1993540 RepID=A0A2N7AUF0_9LACO|nr:GNAT family N-acetyltransferase [Companilactobacillus nuruki]PMD70762.1 GNAT family N-acetyltransferase [Companilactobacillus nuruki]
MKIISVHERTNELIEQLIIIWESSVRATHSFLSDNAIENFKKSLPQIIMNVPELIVVQNEQQTYVAFMGIDKNELEMLFVSADQRGQGIGKKLITYGIENYNVNQLTVNEQNPQAVGFYQHMGFEIYKRTELDDSGNPYPTLYMKKKDTTYFA